MPLSRYLKIFPCHDDERSYLVYSTRKGSLVRLTSALLTAAREDRLSENDRRTLSRLQVVVDDLMTERQEMCAIVSRNNDRSHRFRVIIVLNLDCNLACPYCYEDPFRGKHYMSEETADLLVEKLVRDHLSQGQEVQVDFYGGEALLSLPRIKKIAGELSAIAHSLGSKFSFGMVTNGTLLTRSVVEALLPLGFTGAKITLDGPKEIHDLQRPFVSGKGSFDTIVGNLQEIADLIDLQVGGNFTADNFRNYPQVLDHLMAQGLTPDRLGLVQFAPIIPKATNAPKAGFAATCSSSAEEWLAEAALFLREETLKRGYAVHKTAMAACMVEFDDFLAVNYDGTLFKCPAFIGWPQLAVGTLSTGVSNYSVSHNLDLWKNDECLDCSYLPICFGGCRFLTLVKQGTIDRIDCRKEFYDATLEIILRQDLLYGAASAKPPANEAGKPRT